MAGFALVRSLISGRSLPVETDTGAFLTLTEPAISDGTRGLRFELGNLYEIAWRHATEDERRYLPVIRQRITEGSLTVFRRDRFDGEIVHS
ncbi:MAG: hypothetical protein WCF90_05440, partial [Methanomicrobiales archaeon]